MARATDDLLIATPSIAAYKTIVKIFANSWKIHDMGIVENYFGLRFIHSANCLTLDQTHLVYNVLHSIFGGDWQVSLKTDIVPMQAGTAHKEALAACIPYNEVELEDAVKHYGFSYRTQFQHLSQWTRLDIQTATQRLAQYQNAPGKLHFDGLVQIAKYLCRHPDLPLCYHKRSRDQHSLQVNMLARSGCWLGNHTISSVEAHQFGGNQLFGMNLRQPA